MNILTQWQVVNGTPVVHLTLPAELDPYGHAQMAAVIDQSLTDIPLPKKLALSCYRGVPLESLARVIAFGIDVEPTDAPIYVGSLDKALEYGGWPKVIAVLDAQSLRDTFVELSDDAAEELVAMTREKYPNEVRGPEGTTRWFSRLRADDLRVGSPYEIAYARWIPADAREALLGVIVCEHASAADRAL